MDGPRTLNSSDFALENRRQRLLQRQHNVIDDELQGQADIFQLDPYVRGEIRANPDQQLLDMFAQPILVNSYNLIQCHHNHHVRHHPFLHRFVRMPLLFRHPFLHRFVRSSLFRHPSKIIKHPKWVCKRAKPKRRRSLNRKIQNVSPRSSPKVSANLAVAALNQTQAYVDNSKRLELSGSHREAVDENNNALSSAKVAESAASQAVQNALQNPTQENIQNAQVADQAAVMAMNIVNQQYSSYSQPIGPIVRPKTATGITNYLNQLSPRNSSYGLNNMFQEPNNYYVQQQPQIPVAPPPPPQQIPVAPTPPRSSSSSCKAC